MSTWLFDIFMDGYMREMKAKMGNVGARLKMNGMGWAVVDEFHSVCTRRKLKVNAVKSEAMVFERRELEVVDFNSPYRVSVLAVGRCKIVLGGDKWKN